MHIALVQNLLNQRVFRGFGAEGIRQLVGKATAAIQYQDREAGFLRRHTVDFALEKVLRNRRSCVSNLLVVALDGPLGKAGDGPPVFEGHIGHSAGA